MYYENFDYLCTAKNVKPGQVSKATGVSTATLTSWKQGKYTPKPEKLQKIADFFGVSINFLMYGKEAAEKPEIPEYDKETMELIILFSKLKKEQKSAILNMMHSFALKN